MNLNAAATLDLDSAEASVQHAQLIRSKTFLRKIYEEHYLFFKRELQNAPQGLCVELGSGGGFIKDVLPDALASDVVPLPTTDLAFSALDLPFRNQTLRGIVMINVFHHIQDVRRFLREAERCLKPGGRVLMVEPANTLWGKFFYQNFHHEPFVPEQEEWELPKGGRMSSANDALPWIVFCRDRERFTREFPGYSLDLAKPFMPVRYLISGGVSKPQLLPGFLYPLVAGVEQLAAPLHPLIGMFMRIALTKR